MLLSKKEMPALTSAAPDARALTQTLARYRAPNPVRSIVELIITAGPLIVLWFLMWATLDLGYWLSLLLAVIAYVAQADSVSWHTRLVASWEGGLQAPRGNWPVIIW